MISNGQRAKAWGNAFASYSIGGCDNLVSTARLSCLRRVDTATILTPFLKAWQCPFNKPHWDPVNPWCNETAGSNKTRPPFAPLAAWTAVVDGTDSGLPDVPLRLIQAGKINKSPTGGNVTVILGTNTDEFATFAMLLPMVIKGTSYPFSSKDYPIVASHLANYHQNWDESTAAQIVAAYPASDYRHPSAQLVQAGTDFCFRCGTRIAAKALSAAGISTYLYRFDVHATSYKDPDSEACQLTSGTTCGVGHGAEVKYIFGTENSPVSAIMGTYWTNFAKTGKPDGIVLWPEYDETTDAHIIFGHNGTPVVTYWDTLMRKCDFWDTLPREGPYPH